MTCVSNLPPYLANHREGTIIRVLVQPRASKSELAGVHEQSLKLRLAAPPVDGEANKECIKFVAKLFDVPKSSVEIAHGQKSRRKTLLIRGLSPQRVQAILQQMGIA